MNITTLEELCKSLLNSNNVESCNYESVPHDTIDSKTDDLVIPTVKVNRKLSNLRYIIGEKHISHISIWGLIEVVFL
jgi:hypothetical protein